MLKGLHIVFVHLACMGDVPRRQGISYVTLSSRHIRHDMLLKTGSLYHHSMRSIDLATGPLPNETTGQGGFWIRITFITNRPSPGAKDGETLARGC